MNCINCEHLSFKKAVDHDSRMSGFGMCLIYSTAENNSVFRTIKTKCDNGQFKRASDERTKAGMEYLKGLKQ